MFKNFKFAQNNLLIKLSHTSIKSEKKQRFKKFNSLKNKNKNIEKFKIQEIFRFNNGINNINKKNNKLK